MRDIDSRMKDQRHPAGTKRVCTTPMQYLDCSVHEVA